MTAGNVIPFSNHDPKMKAEEFCLIGYAYEMKGQKGSALESYDAALWHNPQCVRALLASANVYFKQSNYAEAEIRYTKALALEGKNYEALFNLGNALRAQGKRKEAIESYYAALEYSQDPAQVHCRIALTYDESGKPHLALSHIRQYEKLERNISRRNMTMSTLEKIRNGLRRLIHRPDATNV